MPIGCKVWSGTRTRNMQMDYLEILPELISAIAFAVTAWAAWRGVEVWKHRIKYRLAEKVSKRSSELAWYISFVRSPFQKVSPEESKKTRFELVRKRLEEGLPQVEKVRKIYFRAEFHFPANVVSGLSDLIGVYFRLIEINDDLESYNDNGPECIELSGEFYGASNDGDTASIDTRILEAREKIERGIKKYL